MTNRPWHFNCLKLDQLCSRGKQALFPTLSSHIITIHPGLSSGAFAASELPDHPVEVGVRSRAPAAIHLEMLCLTIHILYCALEFSSFHEGL